MNYLDLPLEWREYYSKYPNGFSIWEALCDWTAKVNLMVDHLNLTDLQVEELFTKTLPENVEAVLNTWYDNGHLDTLINVNFMNLKANKVDILTVSVKSYGAIGDGIVDDTAAVKDAILQAAALKKALYFPAGTYLIKEKITIADNSLVKIIGDGTDKSFLKFDVNNSYAMEIKTYYTRALDISNLSIFPAVKSTTRHGVLVSSGSWGVGVNCENVNIFEFGGTSLELSEAFNSSFKNCELRGYLNGATRTGKLLKTNKISSFTSNVNFDHVVFHIANIGIQNLAGTLYNFDTCTFENLDLFLHVPQLAGLTMWMKFNSCWFELVNQGIINADMNETTLTPLEPISNKSNIEALLFNGNFSSTISWTNFLNEVVNPYHYKNFGIDFGFQIADEVKTRRLKKSETFAAAASFSTLYNLQDLNFKPYGGFKAGSYVIHVKFTNSDNKIMRASFISDNYRVYLLGEVYDPDAIGTGAKIDPVWGDATNLYIRGYGLNLSACDFTILYNEI